MKCKILMLSECTSFYSYCKESVYVRSAVSMVGSCLPHIRSFTGCAGYRYKIEVAYMSGGDSPPQPW